MLAHSGTVATSGYIPIDMREENTAQNTPLLCLFINLLTLLFVLLLLRGIDSFCRVERVALFFKQFLRRCFFILVRAACAQQKKDA